MPIQQDSLKIVPVRPVLRVQLNIPAPERIDLERAQEVIEQMNSREDSLTGLHVRERRVAKEEKPSVKSDSLMFFCRDIGCFRPVTFPDSMKTTELERYLMSVWKPAVPDRASDSVVAGQYVETGTVRPSMPVHPRRNDGYPPASVTLTLLGLVIFFTWIRYYFGRNIRFIIRASLSYYWSKRIQAEKKERDRQAIFYANLFSFLVTGVVFSFLFFETGVGLSFRMYGFTVLLFTLFFILLLFLNIAVWQVFGNIFLIQPVVKEYIHNLYLCNAMQGIVIFPMVACIPFINNNIAFIFAIVGVLFLIYFFRFFRFFQIIRTKKAPVFYFILYLCTLEILPFIILIKAFMSIMDHVAM
ncbi:MAG: DUF4271 domain-containing protein [Bacteroidales bacterium]|nr:DUF4271 domain-containing protein [Bacteroidales bacterium]